MHKNNLPEKISKEDYANIRAEIIQENRAMLYTFARLVTLAMLVLLGLSYAIEGLAGYRIAYGGAMIFSALLWPIAYKGRDSIIMPACYAFMAILISISILIGTVYDPHTQATMFAVFQVAIPLIFTDKSRNMDIAIICWTFLFVVVCLHVKDRATWLVDLVNGVAFGAVGMFISHYMTNIKMRKHVLELRSNYLRDYDQLTGLRNRNNYESRLSEYPEEIRARLGCVYMDVNGLHELNNQHGHSAGDKMLQYVAQYFKDNYGDKHAYRIGGDEYVAFIPEATEPALVSSIQRIRRQVEEGGYHVSAGYSIQDRAELDMRSLIKSAEMNMYADKAEFYSRRGNDRRSR